MWDNLEFYRNFCASADLAACKNCSKNPLTKKVEILLFVKRIMFSLTAHIELVTISTQLKRRPIPQVFPEQCCNLPTPSTRVLWIDRMIFVLWQSKETWEMMFVGTQENIALSTDMSSLIDQAQNQILNCWEGALCKHDNHTCLGKAHRE